jgi:hypothetical protein
MYEEFLYDHISIMGKSIYVVVEHHKALAAWALVRNISNAPPYLLTIDHHTDTDEAFSGHVSLTWHEDPSIDPEQLTANLIAEIDWGDDRSIKNAIGKLQHDEHIHAAIRSGVLKASFSIQLSVQEGWEDPDDGIFVVSHKCAMACHKSVYDDACMIHHALEIIESEYLEDQLRRIRIITDGNGMEPIESLPYILDIDLDAFHSYAAANPKNTATIYRLIRGAVAITIAREPECVQELWQDGNEEPSVDKLLEILMRHIETALS